MKKSLLLMLICALTSYSGIFAQDLPSPVAEGFAFPLGLKFTIKLFPADSGKFNYSVIEAEEFSEIVEMFDDSLLFSEEGSDSTISLIFCLGTHGETVEERNENMNVLLIMKNYTRYELEYTSDIKRSEEGDFEPTSNIGLIPGALSTEMWPYRILSIGLSDFKIPPGLNRHNNNADDILQFIAMVNEQVDSISIEIASLFLTYLNGDYSNNAEIMELNNETLFKFLERRPDIYLSGMCQLGDTTQWTAILNEIESPVNDQIDIQKIRNRMIEFGILKDKCQKDILEETISSLEKALMKMH